MRLVLVVALLVASAAAGAQPAPSPCVSASHRQFDFWIGRWAVFTPDGARAGENRIEPIANGCALLEHWTAAGGFSGKSLNLFDAKTQQWHQFWVDSGGVRLEIAGTGGDGSMTMASKTDRVTWTRNPDGTVRQLWESWDEAKRGWSTIFDGWYVRLE